MNKVCKQFIVNTETLNEGADLRATFDGDLFIYFLIGALRPTQEYFNDMTAPSILVGGNRETGKPSSIRRLVQTFYRAAEEKVISRWIWTHSDRTGRKLHGRCTAITRSPTEPRGPMIYLYVTRKRFLVIGLTWRISLRYIKYPNELSGFRSVFVPNQEGYGQDKLTKQLFVPFSKIRAKVRSTCITGFSQEKRPCHKRKKRRKK